MKPSHRRIAARLALGVAALFGVGAFEMRQDELDCESAVGHLASCCPGFAMKSPNACDSWEGCGATHRPALDEAASDCIEERTCEELRQLGICQRAARAEPIVIPDDPAEPATPAVPVEVCP